MSTEKKAKPVLAHIAGTVWKVEVRVGQTVNELDCIMILESMKMEMPIEAPRSGKVTEIRVEAGQFVNEGDIVALIE